MIAKNLKLFTYTSNEKKNYKYYSVTCKIKIYIRCTIYTNLKILTIDM